MCAKIPFESRAAVKTWMRYQNSSSSVRSNGGTVRAGHAYYCATCGAWHWSSMSKAEARRRGLA